MPLPYHPTSTDGRTVALQNDLQVLKAVRAFGHLRRQEIAVAAWPKASPASGYAMACRTVKRLLEGGFLLAKPNTLGGTSVVLAAKGVSALREVGLVSQEGYDLAFDGPQFFHRTLGTSYLLSKAQNGHEIFGEFALLKGWSPVTKEELKERFKKVPDGLITYPKGLTGLVADVRPADWLEVESSFKPYEELKKVLSILTKNPSLNHADSVHLNKLVFVYDNRQFHERRILSAINRFLLENPVLDRDYVLQEIVMASCFVDPPFVWRGVSERTAASLMSTHQDSLADSSGDTFETTDWT